MTTKNIQEIHQWHCPRCNKLIASVNENQFDWNKKLHEVACLRREKAK